jgi:hypothetical protein
LSNPLKDTPLKVSHDHFNDTLTVEGVTYSGELFRHLAFGPIGRWYRLTERMYCDGKPVVCVEMAPEEKCA